MGSRRPRVTADAGRAVPPGRRSRTTGDRHRSVHVLVLPSPPHLLRSTHPDRRPEGRLRWVDRNKSGSSGSVEEGQEGEGGCCREAGARERQQPPVEDRADHPPPHGLVRLGRADARDRRGDDVRRRDRGAGGRGRVEHRRRHRLGGEPVRRVDVDDPPAEGAHDPPPPGVRAQAQHHRRQRDDPPRDRQVTRRPVPARHQRQRHHTGGLRGILHAVPEGHGRRRHGLGVPEAARRRPGSRPAERPQDAGHQREPADQAEHRRHHHRDDDAVQDAVPLHRRAPGQRRPAQPADQRVRRRRRQAAPPGEQVPGRGADQGAGTDGHARGAHRHLDDVAADRLRHAHAREPAEQVHHGGQPQGDPRGQGTGRDRRGDRVGGVVETVGVGEPHRQHDDERDRQPVHPAQDSRTAIASTLSATCSKPFAAASSASMMSLCFITVMGSAPGVLNSSASIRR